jgi:ketosteroid isomerase-like protein
MDAINSVPEALAPQDLAPEAVAQAFVRAINRQDVPTLEALMAPDHRFVNALGEQLEGAEILREGWVRYFQMVPDYTIELEESYAIGAVVVLLGVAHGTYTADGQLHPENAWQTPLAVRVLVGDGHVIEWRIYADNEPIRRIMRQRGQEHTAA